MSKRIEYENKIALQNNESIPERNKVTDMNMNEIKNVVNSHATEIEKVSDIDENIEEYLKRQDILEQKYDEQIKELANQNPQLPEIVDARQGMSTLGSIIKQKIFHFNNVSDMKNCLTLVAGDVVQTLGYHEANDGGSGLYQVIAAPLASVDEGSYIALSNNYIAKLIINDSVNVKQFGAKGDGVTDDTVAIQKVFDYIENINIETPYLNITVVEMGTGRYLVSQTLNMSILCKIKVNGSPVLLSDVNNDTTLYISTGKLNSRYSGLSYLEGSIFEQGGLIDGTGKLIIQKRNVDANNLNNRSVGLEIGNRDSTSNVPIARTYLKNIAIHGFNIGLKVNTYNFYIFDFDNFSFGMNTKDIVYGDGSNNINSGEKISFLNCTIAQAYNGIEINSAGNFNFKNCSFDYLANGILINKAQKAVLNFDGCHFEKYGDVGIGISATEENTIGYGNIIYCNYTETWGLVTAILEGCNLFMASSNLIYPLFNTKNEYSKSYANLNVIFKSNTYFIDPTKLTGDIFIAKNSVDIKAYLPKTSGNAFLLSKENDNKIGTLSLVDDSWADHSTDTDGNNLDLKNLGYKIICGNAGYNGVNWSVDTTNKVFDKSIKFTINDDSYPAIERVVKAKQRKILACGFYKLDALSAFASSQTLNSFSISSRTIFYNKNGIELDRVSHTAILTEENGYTRTNITQASFPDGCDYCEVRHTIMGRDANNNIIRLKGDFEFCGMIVNYAD